MAFRGNFGDLLLASPKAKSRRHQLFWTGTAVHGHQDHKSRRVGPDTPSERDVKWRDRLAVAAKGLVVFTHCTATRFS